MDSFRNQIDEIKSKLRFSDELSKHINIVKKGNDIWCLCFFHNEKTPSMKIDDDRASYYCFGCGAKGDILSFYTDYLNYSFNDALNELAKKTGVVLNYEKNSKIKEQNSKYNEIYKIASKWFHQNLYLKENKFCLDYLTKRKLSPETLKKFQLGFSFNKDVTLYNFLKSKSFKEVELLETGLFKKNKSGIIKDFFYKRLVFPINDSYSNIIGFGARTLDKIEPKYINSSENIFFKKRKILFNLSQAKISSRKKGNLLICEGYMDVISLYDKGIKSVVAPLGTSLTIDQLNMAWKVCKLPTIMFDGDVAGKKASLKSALLALKYLKPGYSLNFLELPNKEDPDTFINRISRNEFIDFLKKPKSITDFIFSYAKNSFDYNTADQKIVFDKYFDDITNMIEDKKVKFFYKKDFKDKLYNFFSNYKDNKYIKNKYSLQNKISSLVKKEILSFLAGYVNHPKIRSELLEGISKLNFLENDIKKCFDIVSSYESIKMSPKEIMGSIEDKVVKNTLKSALNNEIYQLFPYSAENYDSSIALTEIKKSLEIIETRLSNFSELDKSLKDFKSSSSSLHWEELKNLSYDYIYELE